MEENFSFGYWLRRQRLARDIRQADFARELGVAPITLRKIEADERRPSLQLIARVADLLGLSDAERGILVQVARADLTASALPLPERASAVELAEAPGDVDATLLEAPLPAGTVTFLFTDIEGSTARWEQHPAAMRQAIALHNALLRAAITEHGGVVVKGTGDGFLAAFSLAEDALSAVLAAQRALGAPDWSAVGELPVRMALHTGAAEPRHSDYVGPTLNRAARILAAGHGGQILLSLATAELLRDQLPAKVELRALGSYRLKDLIRPEQILQLVAAHLPADFPPLRTLDARQHNLPMQGTALIGREQEIVTLCEQLSRSDVRLVTLTGPGGTGKTRLALQTAAELVERFAHGVWFVNLAPISNPALVLSVIAETLDVREQAGRSLADSLRDALRERQLLLVMDNFEQVIAAAPEVTALLSAAPHLKVLVTSREALHLSAEHVVAVPPLALPERAAVLPIEQLSQYEAVRLFIERARAARADFTITAANAPAVAEICWRLDGLPLAIELAATRVRLFTPEALLARLEQRLQLLTSGARDLPIRQQTLRTTIDWSHALLTGDEQLLFRRLAVFASGCRFEAIEAVCDYDGTLGPRLVDCVAGLVEKSLLNEHIDALGEMRFTMLETIREYAIERLNGSGEGAALRLAHVGHYLALAERAEPELASTKREEWLLRLETDSENLRAALTWSRSIADEGETLLRLAGAVWWFWHFRGHALTGRGWLEEALGCAAAQRAPAARARALSGAGALADHQGDHQAARVWLGESSLIYRALGDRRGLAYALLYLGLVEGHQFGSKASTDVHEECIGLFRESGDRWGLALASQYLGEIWWFRNEHEAARALFEESAELFRDLGDRWGYGRAIGLVGFVAHDQGDHTGAQLLFEESVTAIRQSGDKFVVAVLLNKQGNVLRCLGEQSQAIACYKESIALFRELGNRAWAKDPLHNLGFATLDEGEITPAIDFFTESLQLSVDSDDHDGIAICLAGFGCVAAAQGQPERAVQLFAFVPAQNLRFDLFDPAYRRDCERSLAAVRAQLDPQAFDLATQAGQAMTVESAIAYAHEPPLSRARPE